MEIPPEVVWKICCFFFGGGEDIVGELRATGRCMYKEEAIDMPLAPGITFVKDLVLMIPPPIQPGTGAQRPNGLLSSQCRYFSASALG